MKKIRKLTTCREFTIVPVYMNGEILNYIIDNEDAEEIGKYLWSADARGYAKTSSNKKNPPFSSYLHRIVMKPSPNEQVDHINGNTLDNRRCNLRIVSNQQNQMARHKVVGKSGYKGVIERNGVFRASIKFNGKKIQLGSYKTAQKAARAYNQAAVVLFGEYAVLNEVHYG